MSVFTYKHDTNIFCFINSSLTSSEASFTYQLNSADVYRQRAPTNGFSDLHFHKNKKHFPTLNCEPAVFTFIDFANAFFIFMYIVFHHSSYVIIHNELHMNWTFNNIMVLGDTVMLHSHGFKQTLHREQRISAVTVDGAAVQMFYLCRPLIQ